MLMRRCTRALAYVRRWKRRSHSWAGGSPKPPFDTAPPLLQTSPDKTSSGLCRVLQSSNRSVAGVSVTSLRDCPDSVTNSVAKVTNPIFSARCLKTREHRLCARPRADMRLLSCPRAQCVTCLRLSLRAHVFCTRSQALCVRACAHRRLKLCLR